MPNIGLGISVSKRMNFGGMDSATIAFVNATGITDQNTIDAINTLVVTLKSKNIWNKCNAIYPLVGGDSNTCSYNLVNTSLFRITWYSGCTFDSNGVTFDGATGYGNKRYVESLHETLGSTHRIIYDRSNIVDNQIQIGASGAGGGFQRTAISTNYVGNFIMDCYDTIDNTGRIFYTNSGNSQGMWCLSRTSLATGGMRTYKNNNFIVATSQPTGGTQPDVNTYLGCINLNGTATAFTNHNLAFVSMGDGLSDTDVSNYYSAVQDFQTTLGRAV